MNAYDTIEELNRLARLPELDDAQLATLVAALESTDSYTVQEDGGYGSYSSSEYEVTVSGSAESALRSAGAKVLSRLVKRLRLATAPVQLALLRVLSAAEARWWATLSPQERVEARNLIELTVGSAHRPLATLAIADDQVSAPVARARDLITLRLLAIDDGARATDAVFAALMGPSPAAKRAAVEAAAFLGGAPALGPKLVDALLDPHTTDRHYVASAISAAQLRLDATQRARLLAVVSDRELGWYARQLLAPFLGDARAETELPLAEQLLPAIAQALAEDTNEGAWRSWLDRCGRADLGRALVPVLRERLARGGISDSVLQHMALVGPALAPLAPELLPYLAPATSPSARHVHVAIGLAEKLESPLTVPALIALLATGHQFPALRALEALGPQAAAAIPALEEFRFVRAGVGEDVVRKQQAATLAKLRGR